MSEPPDLRIAHDAERQSIDAAGSDEAVDGEEQMDMVDRLVLPYMQESTLWPILIVIVLHVVAFIAPLIVFAARDRSFVSGFALLWLVFLTVQAGRYEVRRGRRLGPINGVMLTTWILSVAAAFFGHRADIL